MAAVGQPGDRLRHYLRELSPGARSLLITEFERALLRGDEVPGGNLLLDELRRAARESRAPAPRIDNPARLFFSPLEPFLVDHIGAHRPTGRIARSSLAPIWQWIIRDLLPDEARSFADAAGSGIVQDDRAACERLACDFQDRAAERIQRALAAASSDEKEGRRLAAQIGGAQAREDLRELNQILMRRDTLALIASRLPGHIRHLADRQIEDVKALLDSPAARHGGALRYALVLVMRRLSAPWQLIRLAVAAARSDDAGRIAATPYAVAVEIVLGEMERLSGELAADLERGGGSSRISLLKALHDGARGLRTELDLASDSAWSRRLAAIRAEISGVLEAAIEPAPGQVRRLLRPRSAGEILPGSTLDPSDIADTEALVLLLGACRNYASELAISEMTTRALGELQLFLDSGVKSLLEGLRGAAPGNRPYRQSQVDAAVRFCACVFGPDYASLLTMAAGIAAQGKSAARA